MIVSSVETPGAGATACPSRCAAFMWRAKCAATRGAAAFAPPYREVSIDDHCRLQMMIDVVIQVDRGRRWLRMREPARVIDVRDAGQFVAALREIENLTKDHGYYAAGFITYEAGRAFGMRTCAPQPDLPLAWFALFDNSHVVEIPEPAASAPYEISSLAPSVDQTA